MQLNDSQLLEKVNVFSKKNSINSMFVIGVIEFAALLKKNKGNYQDPITIWRDMWSYEERALRTYIDNKIEKEPEFAKEYNRQITQSDIDELPEYIKSELSGNVLKLKYKELAVNRILCSRLYEAHPSLTPTKIISMVLKEFKTPIEKLSKAIEYKPYKVA